MAAGVAAEAEVSVVLAGQGMPGRAVLRRRRDLGAVGGAGTWTRGAVTVVAAEVAEAHVVAWAGAGDADCSRGRSGCGAGAGGA